MSELQTLICTVGTSLDNNLKFLPDNFEEFSCGKFKDDSQALANQWPDVLRVKGYYKSGDFTRLGETMAALPDTAMLCGAEINSIAAMLKGKLITLNRLVFLVSDTREGELMGRVLQAYFGARKKELALQFIEYSKIEGMQDQRPQEFRTRGLRNLVREMGRVIHESGGMQYVAINATGGYKAQIAIAVLVGQSLDIPVYYKHERFNEIISFPPLPVSLDYTLLGQYGYLLAAFERGDIIDSDEIGNINEKLRALLDEIEVDGKLVWELSPIGQIYLTGFRLRYPRPVNLPSISPEKRKAPTFGNDHHRPGNRDQFFDYVNKIWREVPWIKTCHTIAYDHQAAIKENRFYIKQESGQHWKIIGEYKVKDFGARFEVFTATELKDDLIWAVNYLNRCYGAD